ncbi:MAG: aminotransferase class III-fold pyridoxal phosphate-dependent enzyme, partial [Gammaproteobacteria bacterium]|nr:aminotransferase class III-fold pyridoxal phosphate-dependent enzyme [Gammaproteobacteria bacterium]
LVRGFLRAPYNDIEALRNIAKNKSDAVAVLVEPIQGEGGINIPDENYLTELRALCDTSGWLLMLDEIQTGMGRTGKWFAWQHSGAKPDVMTLAKSLGNGVPIGACLASGAAAELMKPGSHGSTFGGNPLACRAGLAVMETLDSDNLIENAAHIGTHLLNGLQESLGNTAGVVAIRGKGLMLGIELDRPCSALVGQALERGLLINVTADRVIRLLPPLIMTTRQADILIEHISELVARFLEG